jgi:hypothetical protein
LINTGSSCDPKLDRYLAFLSRAVLTAQELERLRCHPDFLGCLAHILVYCQQEDTGHRSVAGLLLKNGITQSAEALPSMQYIKAAMLQGLAEPVDIIRHTAGTVISTILGMEETGSWNEALSALANGMASQDEKVVDVSLGLSELWAQSLVKLTLAGRLQHVAEDRRGLPPSPAGRLWRRQLYRPAGPSVYRIHWLPGRQGPHVRA